MKPIPPLDPQFSANAELALLALGGVMTIGLGFVVFWLVRTMRREDREIANESDEDGA